MISSFPEIVEGNFTLGETFSFFPILPNFKKSGRVQGLEEGFFSYSLEINK